MSDYSLLKVVAEAAEAERLENGHRWPEVDECDWFDTSSGPEYEYLCYVSPTTVLGLLSENESFHKHWQNESSNVQVMLAELIKIKAENESMANRLLLVDIVHGPKAEMRWSALISENESLRNAVNIDIEAAAKMLAACMDYPWEHMPANGRDLMRRHAKDIVDAAISSPENPS